MATGQKYFRLHGLFDGGDRWRFVLGGTSDRHTITYKETGTAERRGRDQWHGSGISAAVDYAAAESFRGSWQRNIFPRRPFVSVRAGRGGMVVGQRMGARVSRTVEPDPGIRHGVRSDYHRRHFAQRQHFASDALIGSFLGWYFARQVYRAHHDIELGGTSWGNLLAERTGEKSRNPANMGSPYVPIDSWVYPAFDRLIALGYIQSAYLGIRPWTRMECARLLEEAGEKLGTADDDLKGQQIYRELSGEFAVESARQDGAVNVGASVDSLYARSIEIAGPPLRDGYHFGQTLINDYGRPYGEGFNGVAGITAHAEFGPFAIYIRGEYQQAPAVASDPAEVLQATAAADLLCVQANAGPGCATVPVSELNNATAQVKRFRLLDSAIVFNFHNIQVSFGKESEWLGPSESGPLLLSNNADPIPMLRVDNVSPFHFPLLSRLFGPARMDFFVGQLSGQKWDFAPPNLVGPGFAPQPFIHENKISFKPTENLEFGMGVTAMFGGPGLPFTWNEFVRSYYVHKNSVQEGNPAKRFSALDISYRVPHLRNWLTVYNDSVCRRSVFAARFDKAGVEPGIVSSAAAKSSEDGSPPGNDQRTISRQNLERIPAGLLVLRLALSIGLHERWQFAGKLDWAGRSGRASLRDLLVLVA